MDKYVMGQLRQNRRYRQGIMACCLLIALAAGIYSWLSYRNSLVSVLTDVQIVPEKMHVFPSFEGMISVFFVSPGQYVPEKAPLFSLDSTELAAELAEARQRLSEYEMMVPPERLHVVAGAAEDFLEDAPLEIQLRQMQKNEQQAKERIEALSMEVSRQGIVAHREKNSGQAKGDILAQANLEKVRQELAQAKEAFEKISLKRAGIETDIRRARILQEKEGVTAIPEKQRVAAYEAQLAKVKALQTKMEFLTVTSPVAGQIVSVDVRPGAPVDPHRVVLTIAPEKNMFALQGISEEPWITPGCRAKVYLATSTGNKILDGYVTLVETAHVTPAVAKNEEQTEKKYTGKKRYIVSVTALLPEGEGPKQFGSQLPIQVLTVEVFKR